MDCKNATWKVALVWCGLNSYIRGRLYALNYHAVGSIYVMS